MKLTEARKIVDGSLGRSGYSVDELYGVSKVRQAVKTIQERKSSTEEDREKAESVMLTLYRYDMWK